MGYSKWLKLDLHIHSKESNKIKANDYQGNDYSAIELISKLKEEKINLFSITDHNTINIKLYNELFSMKDTLLKDDMNFLIGVELDISDPKISSKTFHCLLFFDCDDLAPEIDSIADLIKTLFVQGNNPTLNDIFSKMLEKNYRNFILIPHYNNKNKGIKEQTMQRTMNIDSPTLHLLNVSAFDAFEDTNNLEQIQKSLKKYKEAGCEDLPILIFSDNHNLDKYPENKNGSKADFRYILGNVHYPFNSIKLSFKEADLRMGFESASDTRNISTIGKYIKSIKYNNTIINMSPYQNTIIGGFGSGKSFLKDLIINGKNNLNTKYEEFLPKIKEFRIELSDGATIESLRESGCNLLILDQNEQLFFSTIIDEEYKNKLQEKFLLDFPKLDFSSSSINLKLNDFLLAFDSFSKNLDESIPDIIDYQILFSKTDDCYQIENNKNLLKTNHSDYETQDFLTILDKEAIKTLNNINIYTNEELNKISEIKKMVELKNKNITTFLKKYELYSKDLKKKIETYNTNHNEEKFLAQLQIKNQMLNYIKDFSKNLFNLNAKTSNLEEEISEKRFKEISKLKNEKIYQNYKLIVEFNPKKSEYENVKNSVLKSQYRYNNFFKGVVETKATKGTFAQNKSLKDQLQKYCDDYFIKNFIENKYDIEINDKSIMKMSAGEKANNLIVLLFEILKSNEENTIIIMDQPEDNLDNKNIYNEIVDKILKLKKENKMPQVIFVTHNSNIAVSADSENIIIAKKSKTDFNYDYSGIENKIFSEKICQILEGGTEALKKRGVKFSVPFVKEYGEV